MSIDIGIGSILSNEDAEHFSAAADRINTAMQQVEQEHNDYSWVHTDEIRCRGCRASLDVPRLASNKANADLAFERHQSQELDIILGMD